MAKALVFVPYLLLAVNAATQDDLRSMSASDTQEILKEWGLHEEFGDSVRFCIVVSRHTKLPGYRSKLFAQVFATAFERRYLIPRI